MICTCETTCLTGISFKREREEKLWHVFFSSPAMFLLGLKDFENIVKGRYFKLVLKWHLICGLQSRYFEIVTPLHLKKNLCTEVPVAVSGQPTPFWSLDGSWYQRKIEILKRMICSAWSPSGCCTSHFWPQICSSRYISASIFKAIRGSHLAKEHWHHGLIAWWCNYICLTLSHAIVLYMRLVGSYQTSSTVQMHFHANANLMLERPSNCSPQKCEKWENQHQK